MATDDKKTPLKDGQSFIVLRDEITYGQDLDILDASLRDGRFNLAANTIARICGWVEAWSFGEKVTPEAVASLKPDVGREIAALVTAHVDHHRSTQPDGGEPNEGEA